MKHLTLSLLRSAALAAAAALASGAVAARAQTAPPPPSTPPQVRRSVDTAIVLRIAPASARDMTLSRMRLDSLRRVLKLLETQVVGSPGWAEMQARVTSLLSDLREQAPGALVISPASGDVLPMDFAPLPVSGVPMPRGWIGLSLEGPHDLARTPDGESVHYFDYPLIVSVDPSSPADRSGISRGDLLVAYDGADVRQNWVNMGRLLQPDKRIRITVRRDGQTKQFNVKVDSAPRLVATRVPLARLRASVAQPGIPIPAPFAPMTSGIALDGLFGAALSDVTPDLSAALRLPAGVLVNRAAPESPAYKFGLRAGDVITSAAGESVATFGDLVRLVVSHARDQQITLDLRRKGKPRQITIHW